MATTAERLQVEVGADTSEADRKLNDLGNSSGGGRWTGALKAAGVGAFAAIGAAGVAVVGTGLKVAADMEQADIAFTTMLGSGEKAKVFLDELKAFAASTPFEFPELQKAASSLISAGFEAGKVIPIMTTLGDVTSGMGTGAEGVQRATIALQQMSAAGRITGEDLNQLRDAGVPVFDLLAAATGKSKDEIAALAQAGKLGKTEMEALFKALETGKGLERFNGLMEKQSKSLTGMLSTLKDTVGQSLAGMMGPVVGELEGALPQVTAVIDKALTAVGPSITTLASGLISALTSILPTLVPILGAVAEALGQTFTALAPAVADLLPAFLSILQAVLPILPALASILVAMTPAIVLVANGFAAFINAVPPAVLTAIAAALFLLLGPITPLMAAVMGLALVASFLMEHWSGIAGFFTDLWGNVSGIFTGATGFLTGHLGAFVRIALAILTGGGSEIVRFFIGHWSQITGAVTGGISTVVGLVTGLPGRIIGALSALGGMLYNLGVAAFDSMWRGINSIVPKLLSLAADLVKKLVSKLNPANWFSTPEEHYRMLWGAAFDAIAAEARGALPAIGRQVDRVTALTGIGPSVGVGSIGPNTAAASAGGGARAAGPISITVEGNVWREAELFEVVRGRLLDLGIDLVAS